MARDVRRMIPRLGVVAGLLTGLMIAPLMASQALAGDLAGLRVIGFSKDGRSFAFEEYGIQDGSGFPYSTVYALDLDEDAWLSGTPVRVRLEDEAASLLEVRHQVMTKANGVLESHDFSNPGRRLASQPIGEVDGDPYTLGFGLPDFSPLDPPRKRFDLRMTTQGLPTSKTCKDITGPHSKAITLEIMNLETDQITRLYQDSKVPGSRGCPLDYRISELWIPDRNRDPKWAVALVSVFSYGFEGPDRRYIAIPFKLPQ